MLKHHEEKCVPIMKHFAEMSRNKTYGYNIYYPRPTKKCIGLMICGQKDVEIHHLL